MALWLSDGVPLCPGSRADVPALLHGSSKVVSFPACLGGDITRLCGGLRSSAAVNGWEGSNMVCCTVWD